MSPDSNSNQRLGNAGSEFPEDGYQDDAPPFGFAGTQYFHPGFMNFQSSNFNAWNQQDFFVPQLTGYNPGPPWQNQLVSENQPNSFSPDQPNAAPRCTSRPALDARAQELKEKLKKSVALRTRSRASSLAPAHPISDDANPGSQTSNVTTPATGLNTEEHSPASDLSVREAIEALVSEGRAAAEANAESSRQKTNFSGATMDASPDPSWSLDFIKLSDSPPKQMPAGDENSKFSQFQGPGHETKLSNTASSPESGEVNSASAPSVRKNSILTKNQGAANRLVVEKRGNKSSTGAVNPGPASSGKAFKMPASRKQSIEQGGLHLSSPTSFDKAAKSFAKASKSLCNSSPEYGKASNGSNSMIDRRSSTAPNTQRGDKSVSQLETSTREPRYKIKRENTEQATLEALLITDKDLRDWLELTGYEDEEHRQTALNRYRNIAALDAEKAKLMEEVEQEGRNGFPLAASLRSASLMSTTSGVSTKNDKGSSAAGRNATPTEAKVAIPTGPKGSPPKQGTSDKKRRYTEDRINLLGAVKGTNESKPTETPRAATRARLEELDYNRRRYDHYTPPPRLHPNREYRDERKERNERDESVVYRDDWYADREQARARSRSPLRGRSDGYSSSYDYDYDGDREREYRSTYSPPPPPNTPTYSGFGAGSSLPRGRRGRGRGSQRRERRGGRRI